MDGVLAWTLAASGATAFAGTFVLSAPRHGTARETRGLPPLHVPEAPGVVRRLRERRRLERVRSCCLAQMPGLIDVVSMGLSAGLSFDASLELYCSRFDNELAHAFWAALVSWRIGTRTRAEALDEMADDLDVVALRRFSAAVSEALEFGSPLAAVLEAQGSAIREEQRMQVQEQIEKLPVKMLVPLGVLVVPAMLLAIVGPLLGGVMTWG